MNQRLAERTQGPDPFAHLPSAAGRVTALYVHIPFCRSRCTYCGFVSSNQHTEADRDTYLDLLRHEADYLAQRKLFAGRTASLLYIGGGTPTVLSPPQLRRLTKWLTGLLPLAEDFEFTCEGHPVSLLGEQGRERLAALVEGGVNRLSLGVQDFLPAVLKVCNRHYAFEDIREAVQNARSAGVRTINQDFIYGLPSQTPETWRDTLNRALELRPENLTAYRIRFKPDTPLALLDPKTFPDDSACAEMRQSNFEILTQAGYSHLLANQFALTGYMFYDQFALPGAGYRYEVENWLPNRDTIGLGVSAYSGLADRAHRNFQSRDEYDGAAGRNQSVVETTVPVSTARQQARTLVLGLRRPGLGVDKEAFRAQFGCDLDRRYGRVLAQLTNQGLLANTSQRICLTGKGVNNPDQINEICAPIYLTLAGGGRNPNTHAGQTTAPGRWSFLWPKSASIDLPAEAQPARAKSTQKRNGKATV